MGKFPISRNLLPIIGVFLAALVETNNALRLCPEGGYDLVVAVDTINSTLTDEVDQLRYVQNFKISMGVFSNQLWRATKGKFHINSVELILPSTWNVEAVDFAENGGMQTADFRISDSVVYPHAKNPNLCYLPGDYVELPLNFFQDNANSNEFGPIWKTLLVLFARYRYGAWEEHGFVGDAKFPYFFKNANTASWEVTGCNDVPLVGKFMNVMDNEECSLDWSANETSFSSCRFVPDRSSNSATSSLMHFHWMDSVQDFCDEHNHNNVSTNKQNLFCDHKSVMQVIRESTDYAAVTNARVDVPALNFRIVKQSAKPLLYVLLDRGQIQGSYPLANMLPPALATFLGTESLKDVIAAVGSYPSNVGGSHVNQEVEFSQLGRNLEKFVEAVGQLRTDGPYERDFSRAILEVTEKIKERNHPHGGVILVVKYGADLENINTSLPESNVILALNQQKIILHSIELAISSETFPKSHLSQVAGATNGGYTTISTIGEAQTAINNVINFAIRTLNSPLYMSNQATRRIVTKKEVSSTSSEIIIPVPPAAELLDVFYSNVQKLTRVNFTTQIDGTIVTPSFMRTVDWNAGEGNAAYTYRIRFNSLLITGKQRASVNFNCQQDCTGTMTGRVDIDVTSTDAEFVDIEISTSSNMVDLAQQVPLTIYGKVTRDGVPIENVFGEATITTATTTHVITLQDDGNIPDGLENDGIYSAYYVPEQDGECHVSVRFFKTTTRKLGASNRLRESSLGRLLPIDQGHGGGCEVFNNCTLETVHDGFMQSEDLAFPVTFSNVSSFKARPAKVFLLYFPLIRQLTWISPRVPGFSTETTVNEYEVRKSSTRQELMDSFDLCEFAVNFTALPQRPGLLEIVQLPMPTTTTYYAVKAVYNGVKSNISNIQIGLEIPQTPGPTDPTAPTVPITTPDSTASTTTPDPTASTTTPDPTASTTTPDPTASTTTPDPTASTTTPDPTASTTPQGTTETTSPQSTTTTIAPPSPSDKNWAETGQGIGVIVGIISAVFLISGAYLCFRRRKLGSHIVSG